ncbi:MAG: EF-hand domain-containing protein [Gammaproteobacteria bacterium]|jgi:Ca2+-binding EF-hand superfamily protein|nr:EF-hand domain-containing protein [Gammaproteobacteria bacterium]MBU0771938.1 EF-hand domain-containing protein [Gammaproteobacteria bacterium]MBU0855485.1 EF-hand domain-containing protein [Gammaproteobacteria bacterium]MBU1845699.1 EF-hand domain-containing protein [Gammaproteobacteria bacterium]
MSVSGIGDRSVAMMMQTTQRQQKPDVADMAAQAFAAMDAAGKGYIDSSDLAGALSSSGGDSASADALFSSIDGDSDGKVTVQELTSTLQKVAEQFEAGFGAARVGQAMGNRPPPPPPPPSGEDEGLTVDELGAMAEEAAASGSADASGLSELVNAFDEADTDGDGKVSFQEAMAFREASSDTGAAKGGERPAPPDDAAREERVLARVLDMLSRYEQDGGSTTTGLSVQA